MNQWINSCHYVGVCLNVIAHNGYDIIENVWSSPLVKTTLGDPDQVVMINSADYPGLEDYFIGKVYVGTSTLPSGKQEFTIFPEGFCRWVRDVADYALTLTVTGSPGTDINIWQESVDFISYIGEGYIEGDALMSGNDWSSTPDVISVGAWCANTTERANIQGQEDIDLTDFCTLGDIAYFSSFGTMLNGVTQPTVCAPGVDVVSAGNHYYDTYSSTGDVTYIDAMTWQGYPYVSNSGTSMACPTAAGIIALWLQAYPELTLDNVKDVLANTCDNDEFTAKNPIRWGYGKINAKKGLDYIQHMTGIVEMSDVRRNMSDGWYDLQGRRLISKPTQRGIFIYQGRKTIILN